MGYCESLKTDDVGGVAARTSEVCGLEIQKADYVNSLAGAHDVYKTRWPDKVHEKSNLPFRISPYPLRITRGLCKILDDAGPAYAAYYLGAEKIIRGLPKGHRWMGYLTSGKPPYALQGLKSKRTHLFLRPDFIITSNGICAVEMETSPFGLGLSSFLTDCYSRMGHPVLGSGDAVARTLAQGMFGERPLGKSAAIILTEHTMRYAGQMRMLAEELSGKGVNACVAFPNELSFESERVMVKGKPQDAIYRAFYLHEMEGDETLMRATSQKKTTAWPPLNAHMEEKAIMGLIWESEFEGAIKKAVGLEAFNLLRLTMPKTWIVKPDVENKPHAISEWVELARLSRNERTYVLKPSGFISSSSWSRGVHFLKNMSRKKAALLLEEAQNSKHTFILQEFHKGKQLPHPYMDFETGNIRQMRGKIRLTPYYRIPDGRMISAKATICQNTDRIHATVDSINTAVESVNPNPLILKLSRNRKRPGWD
jgi:hypothetical protein